MGAEPKLRQVGVGEVVCLFYVHPVLGRSVFLDVLIQTQESASRHPYELEITPLQPVDVHALSNSWEKSVGKLVNTALSNNIDLIRVFSC